jgi:predicted transposase YbfD/YdcC
LLSTLELAGAIVTIDAAGCQKGNSAIIREAEGHYLLAVKGNQPGLLQAVEEAFARAERAGYEGVAFDHHAERDGRHGRREERSVAVLYDVEALPGDWPEVKAVVEVVRRRRRRAVGGVSTTTSHYYVSSYAGTAQEMAGLIRGHWGIESLHWVLDVVFHEGRSRIREGHAGENPGLLRRVAVSLLRRAPGKGTTPTKRLKAGWDDEFLLQVLQGIPTIIVR